MVRASSIIPQCIGQHPTLSLSDSHAHILEYGGVQQLPLEGTKSVEGIWSDLRRAGRDAEILSSETVQRVKTFILDNPDILHDKTKVITGGGWDHTSWPLGKLPTAVSYPPLRGTIH